MTVQMPRQPGDQLEPLVLQPIERETLLRFAVASGDLYPVHTDPEFARSAGHPDVFAHGMLVMAYLGRLITDRFGQHAVRRFSSRFTAITPLHSIITCTGTVREVQRAETGEELAVIDVQAIRDDGTPTVVGEATVALSSMDQRTDG